MEKTDTLFIKRDKEVDTDMLASMCKALGHPARVMIIHYLNGIDRCFCGDIVKMLPLAQSTVSQHLKCLKAAGLIKRKVEGPKTCYCVNRDALQKLASLIADLEMTWQKEK